MIKTLLKRLLTILVMLNLTSCGCPECFIVPVYLCVTNSDGETIPFEGILLGKRDKIGHHNTPKQKADGTYESCVWLQPRRDDGMFTRKDGLYTVKVVSEGYKPYSEQISLEFDYCGQCQTPHAINVVLEEEHSFQAIKREILVHEGGCHN